MMARLPTNSFSLLVVAVRLFLNGCAGSLLQRANLGGSEPLGALFQLLVGKYNHQADYSEVIRLKPDDVVAYNNRGVAKYNLG